MLLKYLKNFICNNLDQLHLHFIEKNVHKIYSFFITVSVQRTEIRLRKIKKTKKKSKAFFV